MSVGDGLAEKISRKDLIHIPSDMCIEIKKKSKLNPDAKIKSMELLSN